MSLVLVMGVLLAACAQRPEPAPVTGWSAPPETTATAATIRVQRGDTVSKIAHRYGQSTRRIIEANHLVAPYRLEVGQNLVLPGTEERRTYAAASPPQPPPSTPPAPATYSRWRQPTAAPDQDRIDSSEVPPSDHRTRVVEADRTPPAAVHPAAAATTAAAPTHEAPAPTQVGSRGFIWPVRGHVVEGYGAAPNGTHNDGINIAARPGAPVYAAAGGDVVYVGNELRGYGNLVLIKHEGGYITAYAHNSTILVHKGDHVARGQTIARVGATGEVSEPQLHFEIRVGRAPVDPAQYLPPVQQASIGE